MLEVTAAEVFGVERPSGVGGEAPFVIKHRQEEYDAAGTFRPSAQLVLTERVRTSGLWRALTPEDFKTVLLLFTFLTPNGWCRPALPELADAMGVSHGKAKARLERLASVHWRGLPLVRPLPRPDGLDAYLPGRQLVAHEAAAFPETHQPAPPRTAGKEAVVAHSRARYAKTREEVEAQIGGMMGWGPPEFPGEDPAVAEGKRKAFKAMTDVGVPNGQALDLLSRFDLGAVERQIEWLPQRGAKNPARFLAAAIESGYDAPLALRPQAVRVDRASDIQRRDQEPKTGDGGSQDSASSVGDETPQTR